MDPLEADWLTDLYLRYRSSLRAYFWQRVPADSVDDLVADVYALAWTKRASVPREHEATWLFRAASYAVSHYRRSHVRRGYRERREARASAPLLVSDADVEAVPLSLDVRRALSRLSDADVAILRLAYWDDLSAPAIALALGCSPGAARVRLHRARGRFRTVLSSGPARERQPRTLSPTPRRRPHAPQPRPTARARSIRIRRERARV